MTRHIVLGNQSILVNIDKWLQIRDIYFPRVGQENHVLGHAHKIGIFSDGNLSWINQDDWVREIAYENETLITKSSAENKNKQIRIEFSENVFCEGNIFLRKLKIHNNSNKNKKIKVFFLNDFHLYGNGIGDTSHYLIDKNAIVHYKRSRYFLLGILKNNKDGSIQNKISNYSIFQEGDENVFNNLKSGILDNNSIAQGRVNSIMSIQIEILANSNESIYYYLTAGRNYEEVFKLQREILELKPENILKHSVMCQRGWVYSQNQDLSSLSENIQKLFKRSLLIIKTQTDKGGAIIAANDSDNTLFNKDTYSYMWGRDGALVAKTLIKAGFYDFVKNFFIFCKDVLHEQGCLLHKYNPDKTLGSSWHPWIENGKPIIPIQEDETALVLNSLWIYYEKTKDIDFISDLYEPLILKSGNFLLKYIYENGLPKESYDLWEERRGIFTFTSSAVYSGLVACSKFANLFEDVELEIKFKNTYKKMKQAILSNLYDEKSNRFLRGISYKNNDLTKKEMDFTIDLSLYGIFEFDVLDANDSRVKNTFDQIEKELFVKNGKGGFARYKNDYYHKYFEDFKDYPGNPWFICTLWFAKYKIEIAKNIEELNKVLDYINWICDNSLNTGIMPEQIDAITGEPLSVSPLTWSHSEFVDTIINYLNKKKELDNF